MSLLYFLFYTVSKKIASLIDFKSTFCFISINYLGHDDSGPGAGWFLDGVEIDVPSNGMHYSFKCHRLVGSVPFVCFTSEFLFPNPNCFFL